VAEEIEPCHVVFEGGTTPWILGADAVFQRGCSTSLEAYMMGKRPVSFIPEGEQRYVDRFLSSMGRIAKTERALAEMLRDTVEGTAKSDVDDRRIAENILVPEDRLSADRMVGALDELSRPAEGSLARTAKFAAIRARGYVGRVRAAVDERRRQPPAASRRRLNKWPTTKLAEVERTRDGFEKILNRFSAVRVSSVSKHMFLVQASGPDREESVNPRQKDQG
jgi:hypothetical protein